MILNPPPHPQLKSNITCLVINEQNQNSFLGGDFKAVNMD